MKIRSKLGRLTAWDHAASLRLQITEEAGLLRKVAGVLAHSGDSWFWGIGLAVVYIFSNEEWKSRSIYLLIGAMISALIVFVIKYLVRRRRPAGEWGQIYRKTDPHSFPSGHASRAVLFAVLIAFMGPPWLAILLACWAPCVILARVSMGVHYLSDVLAGALLGAGLGCGMAWIIPRITFPF